MATVLSSRNCRAEVDSCLTAMAGMSLPWSSPLVCHGCSAGVATASWRDCLVKGHRVHHSGVACNFLKKLLCQESQEMSSRGSLDGVLGIRLAVVNQGSDDCRLIPVLYSLSNRGVMYFLVVVHACSGALK